MRSQGRFLILNKTQQRVMASNIRKELLNSRLGRKRQIPHAGDNRNYYISNKFAELGIKPSKKIDRDQDGILDIEDCDPNDPKRQGILSSIKSAVSKAYKRVDKAVGGALPGGVQKSSGSSSTPSSSSSSSSKSSSSGLGSSSSGGSYQGPVQPGTSESTFRQTGSSRGESKSQDGRAYFKDVRYTSAEAAQRGGGSTKLIQQQKQTQAAQQAEKVRNVVVATQQKKGLSGIQQKIQNRLNRLDTQYYRSSPGSFERTKLGAEQQLTGVAETLVGGVADTIALLKSVKKAPRAILNAVTNPKATGLAIVSAAEEAPTAIKRKGEQVGYMLKTNPNRFVGNVAGEVLFLKGTSKGLKVTGKIAESSLAKLDPKFIGTIKKVGTKVKLKGVKTGTGKAANVELKFVGKIPKESLSKQVGRAGKKVTAVSSQQDSLFNIIKRSRVIRKPIPNEAKLPNRAKNLLKKVDKKSITKKELIELDTIIKRNKGKGVLERSFFADPAGRVRPSRLGIRKQNDAGLLDLLSGDVSFKKPKPQILVFPNVKVQKLPKALNSVRRKLSKGQALTKKEADKLLAWQQKTTGKFKPVGFVSREAEITLAPGEVIKRGKKVGVVLIDGKRVPIIQARVSKATKTTKKLLAKARKGTITKKEFSKLTKNLKRETGFKIPKSSISYRGKYVSIKRLGSTFGLRASSKITSKGKRIGKRLSIKSGISKRKPGSRIIPRSKGTSRRGYGKSSRGYGKSPGKSSPSSFKGGGSSASYPRKKSKKIPYGGSSGGGSYGGGKGVIAGIVRSSKKPQMRKLSKAPLGYNVYGRSGRKLLKLNRRPLKLKDAQDRLAKALDNTTSKTGLFRPVGKAKKLGTIKKFERGYMKKTNYKFRQSRIKKGKAVRFKKERFIEKRKYGIDTTGEKKQLSLARYAKQNRLVGSSKKIKRKIIRSKKRQKVSRPRKKIVIRRKSRRIKGIMEY